MVYNSMEMDYLLSLLKAVLNNEAAGDTGHRHDWGPVSYTHLDVYKRQVYQTKMVKYIHRLT